ncbi:unnamed protein product, partial [marine sediment metagenome]
LIHEKTGLPTGALDVYYGITEGVPGKYGDMARDADKQAGEMKEDRNVEIALEKGYIKEERTGRYVKREISEEARVAPGYGPRGVVEAPRGRPEPRGERPSEVQPEEARGVLPPTEGPAAEEITPPEEPPAVPPTEVPKPPTVPPKKPAPAAVKPSEVLPEKPPVKPTEPPKEPGLPTGVQTLEKPTQRQGKMVYGTLFGQKPSTPLVKAEKLVWEKGLGYVREQEATPKAKRRGVPLADLKMKAEENKVMRALVSGDI